ncbi:hypothetical protein AB0H83_15060 [Dactylosporangium sp. NPDC050688]
MVDDSAAGVTGTPFTLDVDSFDVEMTCTTQDGTVAVYGWATFSLETP